MPINASPHFERAQAEYEQAQTTDQKIRLLKKMISLAPKHKGAENLRAQLKRRFAKLKYSKEKEAKKSGSTHRGIKKEEMQAAIVGFTNTGKSSLLKTLTNTEPEIAPYNFTTAHPIIGMMPFSGTQIQLIEIPAIGSEYYDKGIVHTADTLLLIVNNLEQIGDIKRELGKSNREQIIIYNIKDTNENVRKISSFLQSKKYNFVIINTKTKEGIEDLKEKLFQSFGKIRVFTKEPGKSKSDRPMILNPGSTIKDIAEKIIKNLKTLKETKLWGPSSKFPGQVVGLSHKLKDLDVVEFKTR
jgi:uncharacterized protein